jgi:sugar lactone lactonase YvrE
MKALLRTMLICLFVSQLNLICLAKVGIITTYVGPGLPVNGAQATTQAIDSPQSVAFDGAGGFYFASSYQNRVYRVSADGKLALVAGSGVPGFKGDGGPATSAQLKGPSGVAVDSAGNLLIADTDNARIRKVSSSGIIMTIAGNDSGGYNVDGKPATSVQLWGPSGMTVDFAGNIFIVDGNRIRKISTAGIISTVAGSGSYGFSGDDGPATSAQLNGPSGVAVDSVGNIFIADKYNNRIRKVSSGIITTVAGNGTEGSSGDDGPATSAKLDYPYGVAVDSAGNLFIADYYNCCIRKVSSSGIISTVAGSGSYGFSGDGGPATSAKLACPTGVAIDSDNLLIVDAINNRIRKVSPSGIIITVAGNGSWGYGGDAGFSTSAQLFYPSGVAVDSVGNLFIADTENHRVRKVSSSGVITTVAGGGEYGRDGGPATSAHLYTPSGVAIDSAGNLFISDTGNYSVRKVSASGIITTVAGNGSGGYSGDDGSATWAQLSLPYGVAVDSTGNIFIADTTNHRIRKVSTSGIITTIAGNGSGGFSGDGGPATSAQLYYPNGVAIDSVGNLFIVDTRNSRIRKVSASGIITTIAGGGENGLGDGGPATLASLSWPNGVAIDSDGDIFIADYLGRSIRKVSSLGIITTVAGDGTEGFSGDGGPATSAQLSQPSGVAVDSTGTIFIADRSNSRIRQVIYLNESATLSLSAGGADQSSTAGINPNPNTGYATVAVNSGETPYGTAIFSFKEGGVTVSEAAVPVSPPTVSARVFIDYRSGVNALPARSDAGIVDFNTGIAVVNHGSDTARVTYTLRNASGSTLAIGHGTIAAGQHISCFIDQLKDVASDFNLPENFRTAIQFGTLDVTSEQSLFALPQPLSVLSLRGTTNQRQQFIITTAPVADLTQSTGSGPAYFAQFADGGGYTTSLMLMNTSSTNETGTIQIMDNNGAALIANRAGGSAGSSFNYSIPPNGIYRFQTDGSPADWKAGWVKLIPDSGTSMPVGSGIIGYNPVNVLVTESGIPGASATTHARIYIDRSGNHDTGLAIANINNASANITINAYQTDGVTTAGTSNGPLSLAAHGHDAKFAGQFITGLPAEFTGMLDISSTTPFAALTVRSLYNENNDYLMTTFPVGDMNQAAPSPIVFPQIADGGGYVTQLLLLSAGGASNTTISYYDNNGTPLAVGR